LFACCLQIWNDVVSGLLTSYDLEAFNQRVSTSSSQDLKAIFGCTIPLELICTKEAASFSATCDLVEENSFDLTLQAPSDGNEAGSAYYNAFLNFAAADQGGYPCHETFADNCFGGYLRAAPQIPDLVLETDCRSPDYYYAQTGESPNDPTPTASSPPTASPPPATQPPPTVPPPTTPAQGDDASLPTSTHSSPGHPNPQSSDQKGLSAGSVVAIVFGIIIALAGAAFGGLFIYRKFRRTDPQYFQVQLE